MSVIIDIDHETGDLSQYTSTITDSGDLSVAVGAALAGTGYGLQCVIDDATGIYGIISFSSPYTTSGILRARFYVDPNSLTMANGNNFRLLIVNNQTPSVIAEVRLGYTTGIGHTIAAMIVDDAAAESFTTYYGITDEPHYVEIQLIRATNSTSSDGSIQLWIDGVDKQTVGSKDNYDRFDTLRVVSFGAVSGIDAGTSGTFYLDELVVNDDGSEIGPVAASGVNGALSVTLDGLSISSAGISTIEATLDQTLDGLTLTGAGTSTIEAELDQTLDGLTLTGAGASEITAALDVTFDGLSLSATGTLTVTTYGALDVTLDGISISAVGISPITGALNVSLDDLTVLSAGAAPVAGALNVTLAAITLYATGHVPSLGTGGRPVNYINGRVNLIVNRRKDLEI